MTGVHDLAYGEESPVFADLLERIDAPGALAPGMVNWSGPTTVAYPTVWGRRRLGTLVRVLRSAGIEVDGIPRAIAVARSHTDPTMSRCAVVDTTLLPDTGGHWSVHLLTRHAGDWQLTQALVTEPVDVPGDEQWQELLAMADLVVVDGADLDLIDDALATLPVAPEKLARTDRELLTQHGGRTRPLREAIASALPEPPPKSPRPRWHFLAVGAVVLSLVGIVGGAAILRADPPSQTPRPERVATAELEVPGSWQRSSLAGDQPADGLGERAVFAAPGDGTRVIVVVSRLRAGSTTASVAVSLANRLAQRGDEAVLEFAAESVYGGRRVISYREIPASGPPISWYIQVEGQSQVSIGCQRGTGDDNIEAVCAAAVGSVRVVE